MNCAKAISDSLESRGVDGFLISNIINVRYVSGFSGSSGCILVTKKERVFCTDSRYEEQARQEYSGVEIYKSSFTHLKNTLSGNKEKVFMKLIVDKATDRVVGAHMIGPDAGEIIQGIAIAMKAGATKAHFDETIGIHPTAAEEFVTMRK